MSIIYCLSYQGYMRLICGIQVYHVYIDMYYYMYVYMLIVYISMLMRGISLVFIVWLIQRLFISISINNNVVYVYLVYEAMRGCRAGLLCCIGSFFLNEIYHHLLLIINHSALFFLRVLLHPVRHTATETDTLGGGLYRICDCPC